MTTRRGLFGFFAGLAAAVSLPRPMSSSPASPGEVDTMDYFSAPFRVDVVHEPYEYSTLQWGDTITISEYKALPAVTAALERAAQGWREEYERQVFEGVRQLGDLSYLTPRA